ncbi:hypothetical protein BD408DRAFT_427418 [Parasitella parasitica]|nr:hypothetical protein BD408DRAFT_427418 [Parasitella parasitica]
MAKLSSWNGLPGELLGKVLEIIEDTRLYADVHLSLDVVPGFAHMLRIKLDPCPFVGSVTIHQGAEDDNLEAPPHPDFWDNTVPGKPISIEVDSLINSYPEKAPSLELEECDFFKYPKLYWKNESKQQVTPLHHQSILIIGTWDKLEIIYQKAQRYEISIKDLDFKTYLHQVKGCANLSKTLMQGTTELTVILYKRDSSKNDTIKLEQNGSFVRLSDRFRRDGRTFVDTAHVNETFQNLQPCSPDIYQSSGCQL